MEEAYQESSEGHEPVLCAVLSKSQLFLGRTVCDIMGLTIPLALRLALGASIKKLLLLRTSGEVIMCVM